MDLYYLRQSMLILRLTDYPIHIILFRFAQTWPTFGGISNVILAHFAINNHDPSKILNIFELKVGPLLKQMFFKNITIYLKFLN